MNEYIYLCDGDGAAPPGTVRFDIRRGDDIRRLDGHRFKGACMILATPPCVGFTDLPWRPATGEGLDIVQACMRIAEESQAPFILENSRFLQRYIGHAVTHRGPFYFWGDVPPLPKLKIPKKERYSGQRPDLRARIPPVLARALWGCEVHA